MSRRCDVGGVGLRRSSCRQIVEYSVEMSRAIRAPPRRMAALHGTKRGERLMAAPDMQAVCDGVWNGECSRYLIYLSGHNFHLVVKSTSLLTCLASCLARSLAWAGRIWCQGIKQICTHIR